MRLTKIKADRHYLFDPVAHIIMRVEISGTPTVADLERAIMVSLKEHDILNARILMDSDGDCYYVPLESDVIPDIQVCYEKVGMEEFVNCQYKKEFDIQNGELVRFVIGQYADETELFVVMHHLGGDGKSMLILIENILENLQSGAVLDEGKKDRFVKVMDVEYASKYVEMNELIKVALDDMNAKWRKENRIFDISKRTEIFREFWSEREVQVNLISLDSDALNVILEQCRHYGVTFNNLLYTIIIKSQRENNKTGIIADVREEGNVQMGNYVDIFAMEESYNDKLSFWENVVSIDSIVKNYTRERGKLLLGSMIRNNIENGLADARFFKGCRCKVVDDYDDTFFVGKNGMPILLSNIGVAKIKKDFGKYSIKKITFISPIALHTWCNIAVLTINNTLVLNVLTMKNDNRFQGLADRMKKEFDLIQRRRGKNGIEEKSSEAL